MIKPKEKPIIFSGPLIPAIQNLKPGTWPPEPIDPGKPWKWQTRRIVKDDIVNGFDIDIDGSVVAYADQATGDNYKPADIAPYQPGDTLYVRETWQDMSDNKGEYVYLADGDKGLFDKDWGVVTTKEIKWRPSIHMPRAAARLFLEVKNVRLERVQEISGEDILREGVGHDFAVLPEDADCEMHLKQFCPWQCANNYINGLCEGRWCKQSYDKYIDSVREDLIEDFSALWDSIYAKRGYPWENNDWVWVYELMRTEVSAP